mgnify:CR=1 FL=1
MRDDPSITQCFGDDITDMVRLRDTSADGQSLAMRVEAQIPCRKNKILP